MISPPFRWRKITLMIMLALSLPFSWRSIMIQLMLSPMTLILLSKLTQFINYCSTVQRGYYFFQQFISDHSLCVPYSAGPHLVYHTIGFLVQCSSSHYLLSQYSGIPLEFIIPMFPSHLIGVGDIHCRIYVFVPTLVNGISYATTWRLGAIVFLFPTSIPYINL